MFNLFRLRRISFFVAIFAAVSANSLLAQALSTQQSVRPFSTFGIAATAGSGGLGIQIATPLASHFNLRANGSYFSYYTQFNTDGLQLNGRLEVRQVNVSLDWFPFHNGFRVSPGITLDNRNDIHASIYVPPGGTFDLGDGTYTSQPGDPITGTAALSFGNRIAPSITVGYGNLIPRNGKHFSIPVEVGFQYIGPPLISFTLQGSACDQNNNCGPITDPSGQANEQQQLTTDNNDIRPLRFYPIASVGFGFTF